MNNDTFIGLLLGYGAFISIALAYFFEAIFLDLMDWWFQLGMGMMSLVLAIMIIFLSGLPDELMEFFNPIKKVVKCS